MSQWIRADDFDRRIQYSGDGWSAVQLSGLPTTDYDFLNLQDAFLGTAHVVVGTDLGTQSSFSFAFNGTAVAVYGMFHGLSSVCIQNCTAVDILPPIWTCFVDGVSIPSNQPFQHFPWQSYCEKDDLSDGPHVISAQIFHRNISHPSGFYLDFIQYLPSPSSLSSDPDQVYLTINSTDPQIPFGKEWTTLGSAKMTQDEGAFFLEFTGIWLAWYSLSPYAISILNPSLLKMFNVDGGIQCKYTIDGGNPISFMISISPDIIKTQTYNSILLQTATLPPGKHNLTVSGFLTGYPITLDYLMVQQASPIADIAAPTSTSSLSSPLSTHVPVNSSPHGHRINVRAVAGGAISGTLLMITLIISLLMVYKRRKSRTADVDSIFETDPLPGTIKLEPFRDSLEKPTPTVPSSGLENTTLVATPVPSSQSKKPPFFRLQNSPASPSTSSLNSQLPLIPLMPPLQDNTTGPFPDPDLFKSTDAAQFTLFLDVPEAQTSSSSLHSHSPLLPADEISRANPHMHSSSLSPNDGPQPRRVSPQAIKIPESQNPEEQIEVLNNPRPPRTSISRSTPGASDRRFSRIVRHADSGIRLARTRHSENILELPPEYTIE